MLRSCIYCGRIHDTKYDCGKKPKQTQGSYEAKNTEEAVFRRTKAWKKESLQIRDRDHFLCQLCIRSLYMPTDSRTLNWEDISVHHIVPLKEAPDRGLDPENLISLCRYHHEMAEKNMISRKKLWEIAAEQEFLQGKGGPLGVKSQV